MSRRKKLTAKYTPLSFIDKMIYFILTIALCAIYLLIAGIFFEFLPMQFANGQGTFIACYNTASSLFPLPFWGTTVFASCFGLIILIKKRQPFFGNKKYISKTPTIKTYPLFSKEWKTRPRVVKSNKQKQKERKIICICVLAYVLLFLLAFLGIAERKIITMENTVEKYNIFNQVTDVNQLDNADKIIISFGNPYHQTSGRDEAARIKLVYENETYEFDVGSFEGDIKAGLEKILMIKQQYPKEKIEIKTRLLNQAISYPFTDEEIELLKKLAE